MFLNGSRHLIFTAQNVLYDLLQGRRDFGGNTTVSLAEFHEKTARILDYVSLALIATPGALIRWGATTLTTSRLGARFAGRMTTNMSGRLALNLSRGLNEGLSAFFTTNRLGRNVAMFAENNFAKSLLLGASQLYRNPSTMLPPSGHSLYEIFLEEGKWKYTIMGGCALYKLSKYLLKIWPVGMDLGLKTAFAFSAGRHQYRRINLSNQHYTARMDSDYTHARRSHDGLRNMAGESLLFLGISGFAAASETALGIRLNLDRTIGKAACSIDDVLPDIVEKLKALGS